MTLNVNAMIVYADFAFLFACNYMIIKEKSKLGLIAYTLLEVLYIHYQRMP